MTGRIYSVTLEIDAEAYQRMYAGQARNVLARDSQGHSIQFPAAALRRFVTHDGVQGVFLIEVDADNRLVEIRRRG